MNFPQNIEFNETINGEEIKFTIRPYLLNSDLEIMESQVANLKSKQARKNVVEILIMRFCTDVEEFNTDELDINILNAYRVNGIIREVEACLDTDSYFAAQELIDIEVGNEVRELKLYVLDLINSVNSIESGKAEETIKNSVKALEEAKAKFDKTMNK